MCKGCAETGGNILVSFRMEKHWGCDASYSGALTFEAYCSVKKSNDYFCGEVGTIFL